MRKKLQILIKSQEYKNFQQLAHQAGLSLEEWVQQSLCKIAIHSSKLPKKSPEEKLKAIRRAIEYNFPIGNIEEMY